MSIEDKVIGLLKPIDKLSDGVEDIVNMALDKVPEQVSRVSPAVSNVLFSSRQNNLAEAVAADLLSLIPGQADISGFWRTRDAARRGNANVATRNDFNNFLPFLPVNTRTYVHDKLVGRG